MRGAIRVLHVDDEPAFAEMVVEFLEREDDRLTVETATSAAEGLAQVAENEVDCIVSDYDMPDTNGIEFLETVREAYPDLPFILFTGNGSEEVASDAISAGATDYFQKESDTSQYELLATRVRNSVEHRRQERDLARYETIVQAAGDGVYTLDTDGYFTTVNDHIVEQTGYSRGELLGSHVSLLLDDDDVAAGAAAIRDLLAADAEDAVTLEITVHPKAADPIPAELTVALLPPGGGEFRGTVGIARDITARKEREQQLARYETLLKE